MVMSDPENPDDDDLPGNGELTLKNISLLINRSRLRTEKMISEVKAENVRHGERYEKIHGQLTRILTRLDIVEKDVGTVVPVDPLEDKH